MAKTTTAISKVDYIRAHNKLTANELIAKGEAEGIHITDKYIYKTRSKMNAERKATKKKSRKASAPKEVKVVPEDKTKKKVKTSIEFVVTCKDDRYQVLLDVMHTIGNVEGVRELLARIVAYSISVEEVYELATAYEKLQAAVKDGKAKK